MRFVLFLLPFLIYAASPPSDAPDSSNPSDTLNEEMETLFPGSIDELTRWALEEVKLEAIKNSLEPVLTTTQGPNINVRTLAAYILYSYPTASESEISALVSTIDPKWSEQNIESLISKIRKISTVPDWFHHFWFEYVRINGPVHLKQGLKRLQLFASQFPMVVQQYSNWRGYIDPRHGLNFAQMWIRVGIIPLTEFMAERSSSQPHEALSIVPPCFRVATMLPNGSLKFMVTLSPTSEKLLYRILSLKLFDSINPSFC